MAKPRKNSTKKATRKATSLEVVKKKDVSNIEVDEIKKSKIEKTRDFLALNKVFFETVAATTLTAMAIVLAWGQLRVSQKQTEYLERQTIMQNAQASPQFVVDLEHVRDNATNAVIGNRINVYNRGLLAHEVKVDALVLVKMVTVKNTGLPEKIVPLTGYFWITAYTGNTTGLMATIDGTNNFTKWLTIDDEFGKITDKNNVTINVELQRYVRIEFRDIFDAFQTGYYYLPGTGNPEQLNKTEGEEMFRRYDTVNFEGTILDLDRMTAQDLYNLAP